MNIAFCVNDAYFGQLAVTITSILENNKNSKINFYVFSSDFSDSNKDKIQKIIDYYKNATVTFVDVDRDRFKDLKLNLGYITVESYYRYVIAELLPAVDKIIYMDADIAINGDMSGLWNIDVSDYYSTGAKDLYIEKINHKKKIGFAEYDIYVNSGVMLLNLDKIRKDNMVEKLFTITIESQDVIAYQDQCAINIAFKGGIKEMDSIYNIAGSNRKIEKDKVKDAVIIHYTGSKKPWHKNCTNPLNNIWKKYYDIASNILGEEIIDLSKKGSKYKNKRTIGQRLQKSAYLIKRAIKKILK